MPSKKTARTTGSTYAVDFENLGLHKVKVLVSAVELTNAGLKSAPAPVAAFLSAAPSAERERDREREKNSKN